MNFILIKMKLFVENICEYNKNCLVLHSLCYINPIRLWGNL